MNTKLKHVQDWPALARQAGWSASGMAKLCGVSLRTLNRHISKEFRSSTRDWLAGQRHHISLELLCDGSSIKEAASALGYKQQSNFTRYYKRQVGICPSLFAGGIAPPKPQMSEND